MKMGNVGNKFFLSEDERKYTFDNIEKDSLFEKEVLVFQWYDNEDEKVETKLIFRLLNGTSSWCKIRKERTSDTHADKTIEYISAPNLQSLIEKPFLCKRRSVLGNIYVDRFIESNGICINMLENEGNQQELDLFAKTYKVQNLTDVTSFQQYHSREMAIPFLKKHMIELQLLLKNFQNIQK